MKTRITELLGIEYPIIQGGMAWVAEHNLAAAVSNAGGLGIIGAASAPAEVVRDEIRKCKELTDKPFGVNVMLLNPNADEVADVIVEEGVKVVTTGAGNPAKYMEKWKAAGVKVIPVVASPMDIVNDITAPPTEFQWWKILVAIVLLILLIVLLLQQVFLFLY